MATSPAMIWHSLNQPPAVGQPDKKPSPDNAIDRVDQALEGADFFTTGAAPASAEKLVAALSTARNPREFALAFSEAIAVNGTSGLARHAFSKEFVPRAFEASKKYALSNNDTSKIRDALKDLTSEGYGKDPTWEVVSDHIDRQWGNKSEGFLDGVESAMKSVRFTFTNKDAYPEEAGRIVGALEKAGNGKEFATGVAEMIALQRRSSTLSGLARHAFSTHVVPLLFAASKGFVLSDADTSVIRDALKDLANDGYGKDPTWEVVNDHVGRFWGKFDTSS